MFKKTKRKGSAEKERIRKKAHINKNAEQLKKIIGHVCITFYKF